MKPQLEFPEDPLQRFLTLAEAIATKKRWFHGWSMLRFAALGLQTVPGDPVELVERLERVVKELDDNFSWLSSIGKDLRFCLAAAILRHGGNGVEFAQTLGTARTWFREAKLSRSEIHEALATIVLIDASADGRPTRDQVFRLAEVHQGMRRLSRFFTHTDDYPAAALLAQRGDDLGTIEKRLGSLYENLRQLRFKSGNDLQLATHLLYFADVEDQVIASRFHALYKAFANEGLHMHRGDYDEIASLSLLDHDPSAIVQRVLSDRETLRERLRPKPSKQEGFTFASTTTFLTFAVRNRKLHIINDAVNLAQVISLIQAQQAAAAVAASSAAASAGAG